MITRLKIENFKSLRDVDLRLGPFNLFVGANASGKSNLLDALRILQGIGLGLSVAEIFDGKPKSSSTAEWPGIRGGGGLAAYRYVRSGKKIPVSARSIGMRIESALPNTSVSIDYSIRLRPRVGKVEGESLCLDGKVSYSTEKVTNDSSSPVLKAAVAVEKRGKRPHLQFSSARPILGQLESTDWFWDLGERWIEDITLFALAMQDMQHLDLNPKELRDYARGRKVVRMGERGENFAAVVEEIIKDPKLKNT